VAITEHFESLGKTGFISVPFGERAHDLWVISDKSGANASNFKVLSDELVNQSGSSTRGGTFNFKFSA